MSTVRYLKVIFGLFRNFPSNTSLAIKMKSRTNGASRGQKAKSIQGEGPNWILIAGVALLSTLSIRLGYKLKQTLDSKQQSNAGNALKGSGKSSERRRSPGHHLHTNMYSFTQDNDGCFNCVSGADGMMEMKHQSHAQILSESDGSLPLVTVPIPEFTKENRVMWASSPDCLELPPKPFHHSNCSDSPSVSESGSDIFSRREVIHKLRQQLKRRDDMILEMQDQILELQNSLNTQLAFSSNLQSQLDAANGDLLDSEREIQRLRQAIEAHCAGQVDTDDKPSRVTSWPTDPRNGHTNGHTNGYIDGVSKSEFLEKGKGDWERIELLKREVGELKEVIEGKEYLLRSYKEQKTELSMKIKELQQRLDSHVPSIL